MEVLAGQGSYSYTSDQTTILLCPERWSSPTESPPLGGCTWSSEAGRGHPPAGQTGQTSSGHQGGDGCRSQAALTPRDHSLCSNMCSKICGTTETAPTWQLQARAPDWLGLCLTRSHPGTGAPRAQSSPESALIKDSSLRTVTPWAPSFILLH